MRHWNLRDALLSATALTVSAAAAPALAQPAGPVMGTRLEEIIVTAQKREQRLQDVPVAVSAVTSEVLQANRITSVRELDGLTPGLTVKNTPGGTSLPFYSLRGLYASGNQPATDRGISLYIDGVYMGGAAASLFNLADIARIEVLRGPQGTLFGRNSNAGAISIITREPPGEFGVRQTLTFGNYEQFRSSTSVTTPQMGRFSALLNYTHSQRRGDMRNLGAGTRWDFTRAYAGKPTILTSPKRLGNNNGELFFGAIKGDFDDLAVVYRFDYANEDYTAQGTGLTYAAPSLRGVYAAQPNQAILTQVTDDRPKAVNNASLVPSHTKAYGHSLTATYQINDAVSLKNIAAYRYQRVSAPFQEVSGLGGLVNTGGPFLSAVISPAAAAAQIGAPLLFNVTSNQYVAKQWSEELQLNVDTRRVTFTGGAIYFRKEDAFFGAGEDSPFGFNRTGGNFIVYPGRQVPSTVQPQVQGGRKTEITSQSYAAYGQAEIHILEALDLVAGLRYTKDKKTGVDRTLRSAANPTDLPVRFTGHKWTYNVGVDYKPTSDILVYGKYATGYISGGQLSSITFSPETAKSWEGGIKADWLDNTLRTNLALYSVKYAGLQFNTSTRTQPALANLVALGVTSVIINSGSARAKGVELETTYTPVRAVTLGANISNLDFHYTELLPSVTLGSGGFQPTVRPKWTVALSAQYTSPELFDEVHMTARVDATWRSSLTHLSSIPLPGNFTAGGAAFTPAEVAAYVRSARIDPYWLVNARVALEGLQFGRWKGTAALWSRNLFNDKSPTQTIGFLTHTTAIYEPARTFGVDLTVQF